MVFGKKNTNQDDDKKEDVKRKVKFGLRLKFSLSIILLVSIIIGIMTFYFIQEEAALLKNQIMQFAQRETEHLAAIARESISQKDELLLVAAIRDLNEVDFIAYAYVIDTQGQIIQNFESSLNGQLLEDDITKKILETYETPNLKVLTDSGYQPISHIHLTQPYTHYEIKLESGKQLICADKHKIFDANLNEVYAKDLLKNDYIMTEDGPELVVSVRRNSHK
ncbi:MAG: hypothetical protein ACOCW8_02525, partial [bacterium]